MSDYLDSNRGAIPPMADSANHSPQNLIGTGVAESSNTKAFTHDRMHMLVVGATPVRILFSGTGGATGVVPPAGGALFPANAVLTFRSVAGARYIYMEAADGTSAYTATVWQRET